MSAEISTEMDSGNCRSHLRRTRSKSPPPFMSDLRIILLGNNSSEVSRVGNFILDRKEFDTEVPSSSVQKRSKTSRNILGGRTITLINTSHMCDPQLSTEALTGIMKETVSLSAPGPHAFLLVIQPRNFTVEDQDRTKTILNMFSTQSLKYAVVLTTCEGYQFFATRPSLLKFISECEGRHIQFQNISTSNHSQVLQLLEKVDEVVKQNGGDHLTCDINENPKSELTKKHLETPRQAYSTRTMEDENRAGRKTDERKGDDPSASECVRIVLIGKTGNGKSSSANMILGRNEFKCSASMKSETTMCQKSFTKVLGKSVAVVDTPGLFDTTLSNDDVIKEIVKCISMSAPGPHAFILVLNVGRFTDEEMETLDLIKEMFGPESARFSLVLFTRGDDLGNETIEQYIKRNDHAGINKLITDCGDRVHMFNNRDTQNQTQVEELFRKIEDMKKVNKNSYFTNDKLELAERIIQQKAEEVLREKKNKIQEREEALMTEYKKGEEEMQVNIKRHREQVEVERSRQEKEFKERLEALIRRSGKKQERDRWRKEETMYYVEQKEGRESGEWGMEWKQKMNEEQKEPERTGIRPAKRESSMNLKQTLAAFEGNIEQDKHQRPSERQQSKTTERLERGHSDGENKETTSQMTRDNEKLLRKRNEGQEKRTEGVDNEKSEERKMLEKLELERQWQEELRKREVEDRMRKEKEEEEREKLMMDFEKQMNEVKAQYEEEARQQAEQFIDIKTHLEEEISELVKKHRGKRKEKKPKGDSSERVQTEDKERCTLL